MAFVSRAVLGVEAARLTQSAIARGSGKGGRLGRVMQRFAVLSSIEELALPVWRISVRGCGGVPMLTVGVWSNLPNGPIGTMVPRTPGLARPGGVTEHISCFESKLPA